MKFTWATTLFLLSTRIVALTIPPTELSDLIVRDADPRDSTQEISDRTLEKRRGGGGRGGGGGGSSSGGSSGGRTGSSSGSGSSGNSGGSGNSRGGSGSTGGAGSTANSRTSPSSNLGGTSRGGSGVRPAYGGGRYYAGGGTTPYRAGSRSAGGIAPFVLGGAALGFFPALWLYSAYAYPYGHHYNYYNQNAQKNESLPIVCVCEEYSECGCDNNDSQAYYEDLFNGTVPKNSSTVRVVDVNGTQTIYINGTLPNGTTAAEGDASAASGPLATVMHASGYWVTVALVVTAVWGL